MNRIKREYGYPVLHNNEIIAVTDGEKAEILATTLSKVHSSENNSKEGQRRRGIMLAENEQLLSYYEDVPDLPNIAFIRTELNRALNKTKESVPGKDRICYAMLYHLSDSSKNILLELYNKVWEKGEWPLSWKEAIILPICKPGKDCTNPGSYRPIALTSNVCKVM